MTIYSLDIGSIFSVMCSRDWTNTQWCHISTIRVLDKVLYGCYCLDSSHVWLFWNPMDCSPQSSSIHGIFQARILEWVAGLPFPSSGDLPDPGIKLTQGSNLRLLHWQADSWPLSHLGSIYKVLASFFCRFFPPTPLAPGNHCHTVEIKRCVTFFVLASVTWPYAFASSMSFHSR